MNKLTKVVWRDRYLYFLLMPGLILLIIYRYLPMLGLSIAFKDFNFGKGILGSPWVGLKYFRFIFFENTDFYQILINTLLISIYILIFSFPIPIIIALMLNELRTLWYKKFIQTSIYLPHFISWVIIGSIIIQFLSPNTGPINSLIKLFGGKGIFFMTEPKYFRSIVVISNIWKEAGWGTIIYLASITGIDPTLYEAAVMDGANRWKQTIHITIPCISDTIIVLLLLQLGKLLDVSFEQIYVLYNPMVYSVGDVISTYVYRVGIGNGRFSLTTAIGLFQSLVGLVLITISNYFSKKMFEKSIW